MRDLKLAKALLGSGSKVYHYDHASYWAKNGGYADGFFTRVKERATARGFRQVTADCEASPDGGYVSETFVWRDTIGNELHFREHYGPTTNGNSFSIALVWAKNEKATGECS